MPWFRGAAAEATPQAAVSPDAAEQSSSVYDPLVKGTSEDRAAAMGAAAQQSPSTPAADSRCRAHHNVLAQAVVRASVQSVSSSSVQSVSDSSSLQTANCLCVKTTCNLLTIHALRGCGLTLCLSISSQSGVSPVAVRWQSGGSPVSVYRIRGSGQNLGEQ